MIRDLTKVKVHNDIIDLAKDLKPFQINMLVALNGELNSEIAKVQVISKKDNINAKATLKQAQLKKDINYKGRINLVDNLANLQSEIELPFDIYTYYLDPDLKKTEIQLNYRLENVKEKEIGKFFESGEFTTVNLNTLVSLTTKVEKTLYLLMCKQSGLGLINYNFDNLAKVLGLASIIKTNRSETKRKIVGALDRINDLFESKYGEKITNTVAIDTDNTTNRIGKMTISFKGSMILNNVVSTRKTTATYPDTKVLRRSLNTTDKQKVSDLEKQVKEMANTIAELQAENQKLKKEKEELTKLVANQALVQGPTEERLHVIPLETRNLEKKPKNPEFEEEQEKYDDLPTWEKFENEKELDDFSDLSAEHQKKLDENAKRAKVALENNDDDGFHCFDAEFGNASVDDFDF